MGNFEKVVVLLILLVCAIVLGISLQAPEPAVAVGDAYASGPLDQLASRQSGAEVSEEPAVPLGAAAAGTARPTRPQLGSDAQPLSARVAPRGASAPATGPATAARRREPAVPAQPTLNSLVDTSGERELALVRADALRETASPDYMVYTCIDGDTWHELADFYYGKAASADLLQNANEGIDPLQEGVEILVPKWDFARIGRDRERAAPREEPEYRIYEVRSGDTLSAISTAVYGTAGRWMQIFDANRDVLASADDLTVGVKLRIP